MLTASHPNLYLAATATAHQTATRAPAQPSTHLAARQAATMTVARQATLGLRGRQWLLQGQGLAGQALIGLQVALAGALNYLLRQGRGLLATVAIPAAFLS